MRIALLQMTAGIDPEINARAIDDAITAARAGGAQMLFTPEMSGMIDRDRGRAAAKIRSEGDDPVLRAARAAATREGLFVALGSLAIERDDGLWANRSFAIDDSGAVVARYDKMQIGREH